MYEYLLALAMIFPSRLFLREHAIKGPKSPIRYGGMEPETQQSSAQTTTLYPPHDGSDFRINALIIPNLKSMLKKWFLPNSGEGNGKAISSVNRYVYVIKTIGVSFNRVVNCHCQPWECLIIAVVIYPSVWEVLLRCCISS